MSVLELSSGLVRRRCKDIVKSLLPDLEANGIRDLRIAANDKRSIPIIYMLAELFEPFAVNVILKRTIFTANNTADCIVTCDSNASNDTGKRLLVLFDLTEGDYKNFTSTIMPWEEEPKPLEFSDHITGMLSHFEDVDREGLLETPDRVAKAWGYWTAGYRTDPIEVMKVFGDGGEDYDEMVVVKDIPFYSHCEHHLAPFFGTATVAYIPNGKIIGLSKISRVVDMFARRLQVQERLTTQIAEAINKHLEPLGVGVVIEARHLCMESRGICQQGHSTVTSKLLGNIRDNPESRSEFLSLANKK